MVTRRVLTAGLGLSLMAHGALAQQPTPAPAPVAPPEPVLILDASLDPDDRLTVDVMLDGL